MQKAYNILSKIAKIINMINHIGHAVFFWTLLPLGGMIASNALKKAYNEGRAPSMAASICTILLANWFLFLPLGVISGGLSVACSIIGKKLAPADEYVEETEELVEE